MQRRMTDAKGHRAHKRIKAFKGSITHSKTRWKSSRCSCHQIWILENNHDTILD